MFSWSRREKIIFLDSSGPVMQIEGGQNTISIVGRRKQSIFNDIKEKLLSKASKDVIIKAVT